MPERSLEIPTLDEIRRMFNADAPPGTTDARDGDDAGPTTTEERP